MNMQALAGGAAAGAAVTIAVLAGPLDPPAGPVASTYKTLDEVEPRQPLSQADVPINIVKNGSYYLTEDVFATDFGDAVITINAERATLDLNGFTVDAATEVGFNEACILVSFGEGHTIRNGRVIDGGEDGIDAGNIRGMTVEGVVATGTFDGLGAGISVGVGSIVSECIARDNAFNGIVASNGSVVKECVAEGNGNRGIRVLADCVVVGCAASGNDQGIRASGGSTIQDCAANDNTSLGIIGESSVAINTCSADSNGSIGIGGSFQCVIRGCVSNNNETGYFGIESLLIESVAGQNTQNLDMSGSTLINNHIN